MTDKYDGAKFIHFRQNPADFFIVPNEHNGGATAAYKKVGDYTYVGIAHCHYKDRYVKEYGRAKAMGYMRQLIARPELDNSENMMGLTQIILAGDPDHNTIISLMAEEGYVPR